MIIPAIGRLPRRQHPTDAGADLIAGHEAAVPVGQVRVVGTGLSVRLPAGTVGIVASRSGHGLKAVGLPNGIGVIDEGYRGEIKVMLLNHGDEVFRVQQGDRIAQLLIMPVFYPEFVEVESFLDSTERGEAGFGSTGIEVAA